MFTGRAAQFEGQIHDHNPGISEEGLFWTLLISPDSVSIHDGWARMCVNDLPMPDMRSFENAVARGPMLPSTVAFEMHWDTAGRRRRARDRENRFVFDFREADSKIWWKAVQRGVTYESDPASTSSTVFAALGHERNGVFFS